MDEVEEWERSATRQLAAAASCWDRMAAARVAGDAEAGRAQAWMAALCAHRASSLIMEALGEDPRRAELRDGGAR